MPNLISSKHVSSVAPGLKQDAAASQDVSSFSARLDEAAESKSRSVPVPAERGRAKGGETEKTNTRRSSDQVQTGVSSGSPNAGLVTQMSDVAEKTDLHTLATKAVERGGDEWADQLFAFATPVLGEPDPVHGLPGAGSGIPKATGEVVAPIDKGGALSGAESVSASTRMCSQAMVELEAASDPILRSVRAMLESETGYEANRRGARPACSSSPSGAVTPYSTVKASAQGAAAQVVTGSTMNASSSLLIGPAVGVSMEMEPGCPAAPGSITTENAVQARTKQGCDTGVSEAPAKDKVIQQGVASGASSTPNAAGPQTITGTDMRAAVAVAGTPLVTSAVAASSVISNPQPAGSSQTVSGTGSNRATSPAVLHGSETPVAGSLPEATPALSSVSLTQRMGQAEITIGLHSSEFGVISIRTSSAPDRISAEVLVDHAELASALLDHLPAMQTQLVQDRPIDMRIQQTSLFQSSTDTSSGSGSNSGGSEQRLYRRPGTGGTTASRGGALSEIHAPSGGISSYIPMRLDIRA